MQVSVQVDTSQLVSSLQRLASAKRQPVAELMRQSARRMGANLAFQTQPFGFNTSAQRAGQKAVRRDIARVILTPGTTYEVIPENDIAGGFWEAWKKRDRREMNRLLRVTALDVQFRQTVDKKRHQKARNRMGRVPNNRNPEQVADPERIRKYGAQVARRVGLSASGWAFAARDLGGTRGIPKWKSIGGRRKYRPGRGVFLQRGREVQIELRNNIPWLSRILKPSQVRRAKLREEQTAQNLLEREMQRVSRRVFR